MEPDHSEHRAGYAAIIGKPNAGKSTLMNAVLGARLSIITPKAQTTRHRIMGIYSDDDSQVVFLDTPGMIHPKYGLQQSMMKAVQRALSDADVIVYVFDCTDDEFPKPAEAVLERRKRPLVMVLNKIDLVDQELVMKWEQRLKEQFNPEKLLPVSAMEAIGTAALVDEIKRFIPVSPSFYPKDQLSEHPERFFVTELIREQIFMQFEQEIPYSCTVDVILFDEESDKPHIEAEIIANRDSQKGMLIGKGGSAIKKLGIESRKSVEAFLGREVVLKLFVKSREGWRDETRFLKNFGYDV